MLETIPGKAAFTYLQNHILKIDFARNSDIGIEDAKQIIEIGARIADNRKHGNIIDVRNNGYVDSAARKYFAEYTDGSTIANAIIINNKLQKSLSNMYLLINKPKIETMVFINEFEALEWLKTKIK